MRRVAVAFGLLLACGVILGANNKLPPPLPQEFTIGRHTFFDFGPPTDFYEVIKVQPSGDGISIDRVLLTPGYKCTLWPKVEISDATIKRSVEDLFGPTNPCTIPEKDLNRELKRRKHYLVFSGANVTMQVQCGSQTRVIRSDILDRDMFDPHPDTPEHTSWTMGILTQLDDALGPGVMEKPMITLPADSGSQSPPADLPILRDIGAGKYDSLFPGAPDKPSVIYLSSRQPIPTPTVSIVKSSPFQPVLSPLPPYPQIARLAHVEGTFTFTIDVDSHGKTSNFAVQQGQPLLRSVVEGAAKDWMFPEEAAGQRMEVTIDFALNCHNDAK